MLLERPFLAIALLVPSLVLGGAEPPVPRPGPARLVRDINRLPDPDMGSFSRKLYRLGDVAIFVATTPATGYEIWRTDGTAAGTRLVKDVLPGPRSCFAGRYAANPAGIELVELGGKLFFIADDGVHGFELWQTDGTEQGTTLVKDICPGSGDSLLRVDQYSHPLLALAYARAGRTLFFLADDGVHGFELWGTDGTEAGTTLLRDFTPGPASAFGSDQHLSLEGIEHGESLLFGAYDAEYGRELWRSDGTAAGTTVLTDLNTGSASSGAGSFIELNEKVLFSGYDGVRVGLWETDGTPESIRLVKQLSFSHSLSSTLYVKVGGAVLFVPNMYPTGEELWRTDGTAEGTVLVKDINPQGHSTPHFLAQVGGTIFFTADDGVHGYELWKTDGTGAGTTLVRDIVAGPGTPYLSWPLGQAGDALLFLANDGDHGYEPWRTDGTEGGTRLLADLAPGPSSTFPRLVAQLDGAVLFETYTTLWKSDGTEAGTAALRDLVFLGDTSGISVMFGEVALFGADDGIHGFELWQSDGTREGTLLMKDVNPLLHTQDSLRFTPLLALAHGRRVLAFTDDGVHGREPWITDGSASGTALVKDICPGPPSSLPEYPIELDGVWYFGASDGVNGIELWRSDGTEQGTFMVKDLNPGPLDSGAQPIGVVGGSLVFTAYDGSRYGLWRTGGADDGIALVAPIYAQPGPTVFRGALYFAAEDELSGLELWKTDGTEAGTVIVADIYPGYEGSFPQRLTVYRDGLIFEAFAPGLGYSLWRSDGTPEGTRLVSAVDLGFGSGFHEVGGALLFTARDATHGSELWRTDGTEEGTVLVEDIRPGSSSSTPRSLTVAGGTLFFTAFGPEGSALWKSDGTEEGTAVVKAGLKTANLSEAGGLLLFSGYSAEHGAEPWRSDGTSEGTFEVQDVAPGATSSSPTEFTVVGARVVFAADDGTSGHEPWMAYTAILLRQPLRAVADLRLELLAEGLSADVEASLQARLDVAAGALARHHDGEAARALQAFIEDVERYTPAWIPDSASAALIELAQDTVGLLDAGRAGAYQRRVER